MSARGYLLGIDWANTGDPAAVGEDDTSDVTPDDLVVGWGRDTTQAGAQPSAGTLDFVLDNSDSRYSPDNVSSPIAGLVLPGRRVVLQHTDPSSGATVRFFDGILDTPELDPQTRTFRASCLDAWGRPSAQQLSTSVYRGLRTGDAVNLVLDAIGWRGGRQIDAGATVMPWWWEEGTDAATAIEKLVNSEGPPSIAYVSAGTFVFEDRFHRILATSSTTSAGLFTNVRGGPGPAGAYKMARDSISYDHGLKRVINQATFNVDQRAPADEPGEVWSGDGPWLVPAGGTVDVPVTLQDPVIGAQAPTAGNGIDSDTGLVTATLSRDSGQALIITLSSAVASVVRHLSLTAQAVTVAGTVKVSAMDASSVGTLGPAAWDANRAPVWAGVYDAQAIASRIVAVYAQPRPVVTFEIANVDATYMAQIRGRRISDRITIRDDTLGLNRDFIVEAIQHTIRRWGSPHITRFTCEIPAPVQGANVFAFDVTGRGFDQGVFGVDGIDAATNLLIFDAPFDTAAAALQVIDTFSRTVTSDPGSTDLGQPYTWAGGTNTNYNVAGGVMTIALTTVNAARNATLSGVVLTDSDGRVTFTPPAVAAGAPLRAYLYARFTDTSNWYAFEMAFNTDATIDGLIIKRATGSDTTLATGTALGSYVAGQPWTVAGAVFGSSLSLKIWPAGTTEPTGWQLSATDSTFTSGSPGVRLLAATGNTNTTPTFSIDDLYVSIGGHGFGQAVFAT